MIRRFTVSSFSPSDLLDLTNRFSDTTGTCLLFSGGDGDASAFSFLGLFPYESVTIDRTRLVKKKGTSVVEKTIDNPWDALQNNFFSALSEDPDTIAFGLFGYGMGALADPDYPLSLRSASTPDAYWQRCAVVLKLEHRSSLLTVSIDDAGRDHLEPDLRLLVESFLSEVGIRSLCAEKPRSLPEEFPTFPPEDECRKAGYKETVEKALELIQAGEIYQVNLSRSLKFTCACDPFFVFRSVCEQNPVPFSAYFYIDRVVLVSASPERFLCKRKGILESRPIKGTSGRGVTVEEDAELKNRLLNSLKEKAELLMITDLMRNDLGKVSKIGSVTTPDLGVCETYTNVFHLISRVTSVAIESLSSLEIIRACFPGGSVTGCPKLRAMEVIEESESEPRGIYTGSLGYVSGDGDFDLNILIRTLSIENNDWTLQLGSGIVSDSDPEAEYLETILKGNAFFNLFSSQQKKGVS